MRGTLLAALAAMTFIATLPARAGEPDAYSWTGCHIGLHAGAGLEWAISSHVSVFAEGDFCDFPETSIKFQGNVPLADTPSFTVRTSETIETLKVGVNYRF